MKRIGSCSITRNGDVDRLVFDWGQIHMLSEERVTGGTSFSFGYVELGVNKGHIRHNHPTADEVIYVLEGSGDQMLDDEALVRVEVGDCIWIPKGVYHSTINRGDGPMRLIVVYSPAGAEQVLRQNPAVQIESPGSRE